MQSTLKVDCCHSNLLTTVHKVKKDFKKLQLKKSARLVGDVIKEFPDFEAEFKMLRASLLESRAAKEHDTSGSMEKQIVWKDCRLTCEQIALGREAVAVRPTWISAVEKVASWIWKRFGEAEDAFRLCNHSIILLKQGNRPVDDQVLQVLEDEESQLQRLLDLDDAEDVNYLIQRLSLLQIKIAHAFFRKSSFIKGSESHLLANVIKNALQNQEFQRTSIAVQTKRSLLLVKANGDGIKTHGKYSSCLASAEILSECDRLKEKILSQQDKSSVSDKCNVHFVGQRVETLAHSTINPSSRLRMKHASRTATLPLQFSKEDVICFVRSIPTDELLLMLKVPLSRLQSEVEKWCSKSSSCCDTHRSMLKLSVASWVGILTSVQSSTAIVERSIVDFSPHIFNSRSEFHKQVRLLPNWRFYLRWYKSNAMVSAKRRPPQNERIEIVEGSLNSEVQKFGSGPLVPPWLQPPYWSSQERNNDTGRRNYLLDFIHRVQFDLPDLAEKLQGARSSHSSVCIEDVAIAISDCKCSKALEDSCSTVYRIWVQDRMADLESSIFCSPLMMELERDIEHFLNSSRRSPGSLVADVLMDNVGSSDLEELVLAERVCHRFDLEQSCPDDIASEVLGAGFIIDDKSFDWLDKLNGIVDLSKVLSSEGDVSSLFDAVTQEFCQERNVDVLHKESIDGAIFADSCSAALENLSVQAASFSQALLYEYAAGLKYAHIEQTVGKFQKLSEKANLIKAEVIRVVEGRTSRLSKTGYLEFANLMFEALVKQAKNFDFPHLPYPYQILLEKMCETFKARLKIDCSGVLASPEWNHDTLAQFRARHSKMLEANYCFLRSLEDFKQTYSVEASGFRARKSNYCSEVDFREKVFLKEMIDGHLLVIDTLHKAWIVRQQNCSVLSKTMSNEVIDSGSFEGQPLSPSVLRWLSSALVCEDIIRMFEQAAKATQRKSEEERALSAQMELERELEIQDKSAKAKAQRLEEKRARKNRAHAERINDQESEAEHFRRADVERIKPQESEAEELRQRQERALIERLNRKREAEEVERRRTKEASMKILSDVSQIANCLEMRNRDQSIETAVAMPNNRETLWYEGDLDNFPNLLKDFKPEQAAASLDRGVSRICNRLGCLSVAGDDEESWEFEQHLSMLLGRDTPEFGGAAGGEAAPANVVGPEVFTSTPDCGGPNVDINSAPVCGAGGFLTLTQIQECSHFASPEGPVWLQAVVDEKDISDEPLPLHTRQFGEAVQTLILRCDQQWGTQEFDLLWGNGHVTAPRKMKTAELGKGLDNSSGEYNCFLNVIIQSLWQLEHFRDGIISVSRTLQTKCDRGDDLSEVLLHSLANVFQSLSGMSVPRSKSSIKSGSVSQKSITNGAWAKCCGKDLFVADPGACRQVLAAILSGRGRSQVGEMADASEALNDVLEALHNCLSSAAGTPDSAWRPIVDRESIVTQAFGLHVLERTECQQCGYKMAEQAFTRFLHYVPARQLLDLWVSSSSGVARTPEALLRMAQEADRRPCPHCSPQADIDFRCVCSLQPDGTSAPSSFSLVTVWETGAACADDIAALMNLLPLSLDLDEVYSVVKQSGVSFRYRLRALVCFYGQHYLLFAYRPQIRQWVLYDDGLVKVVGSWPAVCSRCRIGRLQPHVLLYEAVDQACLT